MRYIIPAIALAMIAAGLAFPGPAVASHPMSDCALPDEAMAIMQDHGYPPLGVFPYLDGEAVFYEGYGVVFAAPIDENGCVAPIGVSVPGFVPPSEVKGVPA